jgi:hypothetical protein
MHKIYNCLYTTTVTDFIIINHITSTYESTRVCRNYQQAK